MKTFLKIEDLLLAAIEWSKTSDGREWSAMVGDDFCKLTMNDFPDEPLYTLHWRGSRLDFDDAPHHWSIPFK